MSERRLAWTVRVGVLMLRALASTWRVRYVDDGPVRAMDAAGQPYVFALWHGQLLPLLWAHRGRGIAILVSEHRDGELIARVAHALGMRTVRGSSSRGAARALIGLVRHLEEGHPIAVTPDGPRGPARQFAPGALVAAQRSGAPIVAVAASASRAWRLRSWDRFIIPMPFARVVVAYGAPTRVDAASARDAAEQAGRYQRVLDDVTAKAGA